MKNYFRILSLKKKIFLFFTYKDIHQFEIYNKFSFFLFDLFLVFFIFKLKQKFFFFDKLISKSIINH